MKRSNPYAFKQKATKRFKKTPKAIPALLYAPRRSGSTEVKCVDIAPVSQNFTNAGVFSVINIPVEGAGFFQRIGRRIRMKSVHIRGVLELNGNNGAAITNPQAGRIMVVYDRQANGALPALADLIQSVTPAGATSTTSLDGINMNNRDRFYVLMDDQIVLPPVGINGASSASNVLTFVNPNDTACDGYQGRLNVNRYIKLKGLETHYKASAGAIGDIATGSLFMFTFSNDTNANPAYNIIWSARLKFYD